MSYDGTVRNSNRHLVQLSYGEDGMDGAFMEFQQLPSIKPSHSSFKRRFYFDCSDQRYPLYLYNSYWLRKLVISDGWHTSYDYFLLMRGTKPAATVHGALAPSGIYACVHTYRMLTRSFKEDVAWKVMKSTADHEIMEQEWAQLQEDRETLRSIFPTGNTKVCTKSCDWHVMSCDHCMMSCDQCVMSCDRWLYQSTSVD